MNKTYSSCPVTINIVIDELDITYEGINLKTLLKMIFRIVKDKGRLRICLTKETTEDLKNYLNQKDYVSEYCKHDILLPEKLFNELKEQIQKDFGVTIVSKEEDN